MKKIYSFIYLLCSGVVLLFSASCKKMLDIPANLPGQLITSEAFSDSTTAVSGVVGIYLKASLNGNNPLMQFMSLYPSLSADELLTSNSGDLFMNNALSAGTDAFPGVADIIWKGFYNSSLIYQANAAMEAVAASAALSATLKDQLIGECEVVRALSFFCLVNLYGPVPLPVTSNYEVTGRLPRAPVDTVYDRIIKDLTDATSRLSETYPTSGHARPNKYTAMALLSRVYLYRKQWTLAESAATGIINSGMYHLESLDNTFLAGSQESIWQILSTGMFPYSTREGFTFLPYTTDFTPTYYLSDHLLSAFEAGDQRRTNWISSININGATFFYPYKYHNDQAIQVDGRVEAATLFRLAEQYLIRAEARIQQDNLEGGAADIDSIRNRAGLDYTTASSKADLLNAVMRERQTEFFCEWGHRWLDLKRTDRLNAVMTAAKPATWPADGHAALYPVPYSQVRLNPGWQQNSGY